MKDKQRSVLYNLKILYIEDEDFLREQLGTFIKRRVGKLYLAADGEEGLLKFNECRPDIVITDLRMPKIGGIEMTKKIRNIDSICPIIVTTAISDAESIIDTVDVGIDKYIVKPIDTNELIETIEKAALKLYKMKSKETIINSLVLEKTRRRNWNQRFKLQWQRLSNHVQARGLKMFRHLFKEICSLSNFSKQGQFMKKPYWEIHRIFDWLTIIENCFLKIIVNK